MTTVYTVTKPNILADPSYSPDGTLVVYAERISGTWRLSTLTLGATQVHTVLITSANQLADPSYSEDGFFILYAEQTGPVSGPEPEGIWALKFINADATDDPTTILDDGNANIHPTWVTATQVTFQNWQYSATPSTAWQVSTVDLAGQGRNDLGEGEYPRVVTT